MVMKKKGQVTLFVIVAIFIVVAGIGIYFLSGNSFKKSVPQEFSPVNTQFTSCLQHYTEQGISILESKGGYIENPTYSAPSIYEPFSSQLYFAGINIPYWHYLSAQGESKTQVPTLNEMENSLAKYLDDNIKNCYMQNLRDQGYGVSMGEPTTEVSISKNYVDVSMKMDLDLTKGNASATISSHDIRQNSFLGALYSDAQNVYNEEESNYFLENYTEDVLRLYAPVTGFKISCSPLTWNAQNIYNELVDALEVNTVALTNQENGNLNDSKYFDLNMVKDSTLNFVYSKSWPTYFEVNPTQNGLMVAKPIGNQQGLGILGFCYVPYHFVYNFRHPVLIRVSRNGETFQFPEVVVIDGNLPRKSIAGNATAVNKEPFCEYANTPENVSVYNTMGNKIDANISYSCFDSVCDMGQTVGGQLNSLFPQCFNGVLSVEAKGYRTSEITFSTTNSSTLSVYLEKEYNKSISLNFDGKDYSGNALLTFTLPNNESQTIVYPNQKSISLGPGKYSVQVYLYSNSSITLPASSSEQCTTVPRSGILGTIGMTQKVCSTTNNPEQVITSAITGGGVGEVTFDSLNLKNSNTLLIKGGNTNIPKTMDQLQANYLMTEVGDLEVSLVEK